jgi:eukaryotic-like serine/threonine-protein kinase
MATDPAHPPSGERVSNRVAVKPGDVINGWRVALEIGRGGMAIVYAASREGKLQGSHFVIKIVTSGVDGAGDVRARLQREAETLARLQPNEHFVKAYEIGDYGPFCYLVIERVHGTPLDQFMAMTARAGRPLRHDFAVGLVIQVLVALAQAHALGIIHRDLKPRNLMISRRGDGSPLVRVLDLGIAKDVSNPGLALTQGPIGSPAYMSPEQINQGAIDARTDIWAVGVLLYELLAGREPFPGDSWGTITVEICTRTPTPLRDLRPDVPHELADIVARCLAKSPEDRYPTARELAEDLIAFAPQARGYLQELYRAEAPDLTDATTGGQEVAWIASTAEHDPPGVPIRKTLVWPLLLAALMVVAATVAALWIVPSREVRALVVDAGITVATPEPIPLPPPIAAMPEGSAAALAIPTSPKPPRNAATAPKNSDLGNPFIK